MLPSSARIVGQTDNQCEYNSECIYCIIPEICQVRAERKRLEVILLCISSSLGCQINGELPIILFLPLTIFTVLITFAR